jgi:hypothetical protein
MAKNLSGRVKKTPPTGVSADRYNFIGLSETEPDLGVPSVSGYVLSSNTAGVRSWISAGAGSLSTLTIGTGLSGTSYNGSSPVTIALASDPTISGNLTAASFIKTSGTSSQYLMADGSVSTGYALPEITPLDDISNYFDGTTNRFIPRYQGQQITISNPFRLLLSINGIIQRVRNAEYVWQSMIAQNGVSVDNDGYIVFPEAVPAGSQFDARLMVGPTTTSTTTTYPFRAMDIILGG